jgi:hypothetical protein
MKPKRKMVIFLSSMTVIVIVILGYFLYVILQPPCKDNIWPIPPPDSIQFGPYYLITEQGPLYIGQTYEHQNEGPWVGNMTLVFIGNNGAVLLFHYPTGSGVNYKRLTCRGYLPSW